MNPMEQPQTDMEQPGTQESNKIEVSADMFQDAKDGDRVSVQVEGTLKIEPDGTACIYAETVDGEPVESSEEQDPKMEGMARMKAAGYGQGGPELE